MWLERIPHRPTAYPHVIARLDRAIQYSVAHIVEACWRPGLLDAPLAAYAKASAA
jgi:hypothetical protein